MRKMRLVAVVMLASAALAWSPPERVDRKPEGYRTYLPALVVGPDGVVHTVWSESPGTGFLQKVMYSRRQSDTWTIPANISRDSGDIRTPAIALDSSGRAMVVWSEESYALMRYVRQLGDTWSIPKLAFQTRGITPRLAIDGRNRIHLLFEKLGSPGVIWYSYYASDADSWAMPETVASDPDYPLGWSDITVDGRDRLHAVWMNYRHDGIDYSRHDGDSWTTPVRIPDPAPQPNDWSCYPRIAVDTFGRPHVVWEERMGENVVYHSELQGDTWTVPFRVYDLEGGRPVICCDDADRIHVIWHWSYGMRYRTRADTSWLEPGVVHPSGGGPCVVAGRNLLHLVCRDDWQVFYSQHDASGIEEVPHEPRGRVGLSVAVHANKLQVSFCLESPGRVLVQVLDSAGRVVTGGDAGWLDAGSHELTIPTKDLASGAYLCRVTAGGEVRSAKLRIVK